MTTFKSTSINSNSAGSSTNYVVSVGGEGGEAPKTFYYIDPTYKKDKKGGGGQKSPILRRHSLWTGPLSIYRLPPLSSLCFMNYREIMNWCKVACLKLQNFMKQGSQCSVKCEQSHYVHLKSKTG